MDTMMKLLKELVDTEPIAYVGEDFDSECVYCHGVEGESPNAVVIIHNAACPWLKAKQFVREREA